MPKQNFNDRSELIGALKQSMNIQDDEPKLKGIDFVSETGSIVVNDNHTDFTTVEESDAIAKREAEEKLSLNRLSEEEVFAKLLQQKRN